MCGKWCTFLLWISLLISNGLTATLEYYTAGVVEFRPAVSGGNSAQLLEDNLKAYLELIESANGTTDIIVFPEATLNSLLQLTTVPLPSSHSLCHTQSAVVTEVAEFMRQLACAAIKAQTYLLFNVKEQEECNQQDVEDIDCPTRGYRLYNTNVVLDRSGAIVSRYRKWNLYLEPQLNHTAEPEFAIFETDFNVTFGHFICFDMLFYTPAQEIVERYGIRNMIVTKLFNSEMPFLTASQLQQGWAWGNNVNLLAAGASLPHGGISGSGIYAGQRGALVRRMVGDSFVGVRQLLVARVARWPELESKDVTLDVERVGPVQRQLMMLQQPQLQDFNTWQVPLINGSLQQQRLCHADLCCDFELSLQLPQTETPPHDNVKYEYVYRVGVFVGRRRYEEAQYSVVRLCGLFACHNASVESCGQLGNEPGEWQGAQLQFNMLRVRGEFVQRQHRLLMPSTLSASLYALQATELNWTVLQQPDATPDVADAPTTHVQLQLEKPHSQLLTFAIYGNYFDDVAGHGRGSTIYTATIFIPLLLLLAFWCCKL